MRLSGLAPDMRRRCSATGTPWRDSCFLLPARVMVRKDIDFAIEVIKAAENGPQRPAAYPGEAWKQPASQHYGAAVFRVAATGNSRAHVVFLSRLFSHHDGRCAIFISSRIACSSREAGGMRPAGETRPRLTPHAGLVPAGTLRFLIGLRRARAPLPAQDLAKIARAVNWLENQSPISGNKPVSASVDPSILDSNTTNPSSTPSVPRKTFMIQEIA